LSAQVSDVVTDVVTAVEKLRVDDRLVTSADQLLEEFELVRDAVTCLEAHLVRRARELHAVDATSESCGRSTFGWLREEQLMARGDVSRLWRLLHKLPACPHTEAAFDAAQISMAHALAIVNALEHLPAELRATIERDLVEHAKACSPEEIAGFVDDLLQALGLDKLSDFRRERRYAERGVDLHKTLHGTRALNGSLEPDVGDALERALALAGQPSGPEDDRSRRQRAHDALGAIANAYLGTEGAPSFTGSPRSAIITIPLETLENQLRDRWINLPDGTKISPATARRLACDAEIIPVVLGSKGEVLDIGQANHEFSVAQRRAAYLRDGGRCAFPGCQGKVVELHHIVFRRHGGPASIDNAAWLCLYHHILVHEGGWTLQRDAVDKSYLWTGPHGQQRRRHLTTSKPSAPAHL